MLDAALALPVRLDDSEEVAASDDQLLKILGGKSMETESESLEHIASHHDREKRSANQDTSSASSEETQEKVPKDNERGSSNSGSSEEKTEKPGASAPARRKRSTSEDKAYDEYLINKLAEIEAEANAEEAHAEEAHADESSVDETNADEPNELNVENNHEDYAQGCEVLEENSKEANNETFEE